MKKMLAVVLAAALVSALVGCQSKKAETDAAQEQAGTATETKAETGAVVTETPETELGLLGYILARAQFPVAPTVLGLVLGSMFEREFRLALKMNLGSPSIFFTRPISLGLILIILAIIGAQIMKHNRKV